MDSRTRLLAVSSVQFVNGFRLDLKKVGALCWEKQVLFCVDAIQSLGIIPMDVRGCHIDFLSADAHKWLLGPEGVGIFYCRKELAGQLSPPLVGWKSVQNEFEFDRPELSLKTNALRFEEGSMNLMGIVGLGAALDLLFEVGIEHIEQRVLDLGDLILKEAAKRGYRVLTPIARNERGGNITFTGNFDPVTMKDGLQNKKIMVNARGGGVRVSPHFYNTGKEIAGLFNALDSMAR
jgi:selenocysteine lyase/cysteine desulfurase